MAQANKTVKEIRPAVPAVTAERIVLELTKDEAEVLAGALGKFVSAGPTYPVFDALIGVLGWTRKRYSVTDKHGNSVPTLHISES